MMANYDQRWLIRTLLRRPRNVQPSNESREDATLEKSIPAERLQSLKCIVFDLDGVLFEGTNQGYFDCHRHALESVGMHVPQEQLRRRLLEYWSHPHEFQLSLFIHDKDTLAQACRAYEQYLFSDRFAQHIREIPGAAQTIKKLSNSRYRLAAATGMHHKQIPGALANISVDPNIFTACISAYQLPSNDVQKPHPYMLDTILTRLGISPDYALYVGDSKADIQMAKAAGVLAVAVLTGNMSRSEAENEGSDIILESVRNLLYLVKPELDPT